MSSLRVENLIYLIPAILIAMTLHELAHGWVSYKFGDPTPKEEGRLSLNPFHHLDPFGTLALLVFGFGWAKPVMVNPQYYKDKKAGMMWTALAGPLTNFVVAFICMLIWGILVRISYSAEITMPHYLMNLLSVTISLNIGLGVFNLIPIPPLDGSKVLYAILPEEQYFKILQYEQILSLILIAVLFSGALDGILYSIKSMITSGMMDIVLTIVGL